jgi:FKBP-type peptidyl-prolyl cis-trans isomerase FkpA
MLRAMIALRIPLPHRPALILLLALLATACTPALAPADAAAGAPADLEITVLKPGDGEVAQAGNEVRVHYTGWLYDERQPGRKGAEFDSSRPRGEPFAFPLGGGRVIRGWDEGVAGMRVGEVRELAIPAWLGYGSAGAGGVIPPDQPLLFEVELLGIEPAR